jgi:sugar lactone lactonase YvrE
VDRFLCIYRSMSEVIVNHYKREQGESKVLSDDRKYCVLTDIFLYRILYRHHSSTRRRQVRWTR